MAPAPLLPSGVLRSLQPKGMVPRSVVPKYRVTAGSLPPVLFTSPFSLAPLAVTSVAAEAETMGAEVGRVMVRLPVAEAEAPSAKTVAA